MGWYFRKLILTQRVNPTKASVILAILIEKVNKSINLGSYGMLFQGMREKPIQLARIASRRSQEAEQGSKRHDALLHRERDEL